YLEGREIDEADGVVSRQMASALARVEDQATVRPLDGPPVRVAVEDDVREVAYFEITRIVHHDDPPIRPKELERWLGERDADRSPAASSAARSPASLFPKT